MPINIHSVVVYELFCSLKMCLIFSEKIPELGRTKKTVQKQSLQSSEVEKLLLQ